jgi:hypothetical protein
MSYGVNAPFGLRAVSSISGGSWTEKTNEYFIYTNPDGDTTYNASLFSGDPVMWNRVANSITAGVPTIAKYAFNNNAVAVDNKISVLGVFLSCEYLNTTGNLVLSSYWPASTKVQPGSKIKAYIIDDPDVVFEIQVSTATNNANNATFGSNAVVPSFFGQNFSFGEGAGGASLAPQNPAAGDTRTGQSSVYLNNVGTGDNSVRASIEAPLKALGFSLNPNNTPYKSDGRTVRQFLNVRVVLNNHVYRGGSVGTTPI